MTPDFVVFSSYGNDSIALLQLLSEYRLPEQKTVAVIYSDTGWADPAWGDRVSAAESWAQTKGFHTFRTDAGGFADLVRKKKMFPRGNAQFCTSTLKIVPAQKWLEANDPTYRAVCVNGVRRAESLKRADTPILLPISDAHGGRVLWSPLAEFDDEARNTLIVRAGFAVLPHRSRECSPCIFSNREDLRAVPEERVDVIRGLEGELGEGRTMFRVSPKAYANARGIDEVMRWAWSDRGKFVPKNAGDEEEADCDSGFCGG